MKYPVVSSFRHKGKTIELDATREIITLIGINGEPMGNLADALSKAYRRCQLGRNCPWIFRFRSTTTNG